MPRSGDGEREALGGLDVDEQGAVAGRERRSGELLALAPGDAVEGDVEQPAVGGEAAEVVVVAAVLAQDQRAPSTGDTK
jgi:hypothetical protein